MNNRLYSRLLFFIIALTCAPSFAEGTNSIPPPEEGTPITANFLDANLQDCFYEAMGLNGWVFVEDVVQLNCNSRGIKDLSGIEALFALQTLQLSQNNLAHIDILASLSNLTKLELSGNKLTNLFGIESSTELTYLDVSDNQLMGVYSLMSPSITQLTSLNLSGNHNLLFSDVLQGLQNNVNLTEIGLADISIGLQFPVLTGPTGVYALTSLDLNRTGFNDMSVIMNYITLNSLSLSGNNVAYPFGLENLLQLNVLDLSNNEITFMGDLSFYPQLVSLNLSNNPLDMIYGLNNASNLRALNLSNTRLTNSQDFANLTQLTELHLSGLTIPGMELLTIAQQNSQLSVLSLANIDLKDQYFSGDSWPMLSKLDISHTGIIDFYTVSNLEALDLSGNQLTNVAALQMQSSLQSLDLSGNRLLSFGEIDTVIRNNPQLTELGLSDIQVGYFPTYMTPMGLPYGLTRLGLDRTGLEFDLMSLNSYSTLRDLSVSGNQLTYLVGIQDLPNLKHLDVSDNKMLMGVYELMSPNMTQLQSLNLSGNKQLQFNDIQQLLVNNTGLTEIALADITIGSQFPLLTGPNGNYALTSLNLNRTGVNDLSTLMNYYDIKTLRLSGNNIEYPAGLEMMHQLSTLDLSDNRMMYMNDLSTYPALIHLNLRDNPIEMVPGLSELYELQFLDLSNTKLMNANDLSGVTQLAELHLSGLTLPGMELLNIAQQNTRLTALSLAGVDLSNQYFMSYPWVKLRDLDLRDTGVIDVMVMPGLEILKLAGNQLNNIYSLQGVDTLRSLDLSGNSQLMFSDIDNVIRNNPKLTELGLSDIQIGTFPSYHTPMGQSYNFTHLDLDRTGLTSDLVSLSAYSNLTHLSASGNQLTYLVGIQDLMGLKHLDVSNNPIMGVYELMMPNMSQLESLNLSGNSQLQFTEVHQVLSNNPSLTEIGLADIAIGPQFPNLFGPYSYYALTSLDLSRTGVNDQISLVNYSSLETLALEGNDIQSLFGLETLAGLTLLKVQDNAMINCMELDYLKMMLPNLSVLSPSQCP